MYALNDEYEASVSVRYDTLGFEMGPGAIAPLAGKSRGFHRARFRMITSFRIFELLHVLSIQALVTRALI